MKKMIALLGVATVFLSACDDVNTANANAPKPFIAELPESITSIAAKGQNLNAVTVDPIDGCYVYQYAGPVETTLLPLRARNGRPICSRAS